MSMGASPEEFEARLRERSKASWARRGYVAPERVAYRKAAALLWQFDPRTLRLPERGRVATAARVVVEGSTDDPAIQNAIARLRERLEADDTFGETRMQMHPDEDISVVDVALPGDPNYETAEDAVRVLRSDHVPASFEGVDAEVHVTACGPVSSLVEDCIARSDREGLRWRLLPKIRDTALASFEGPEEARRYLGANLARFKSDSTAVLAAALLDGDPPDVNSLDLRTLGRLREAVTWLSQVPGVTGLIQVQQIDAVLERLRLKEPMGALLRRPFEGRVAELNRLREHIGLLPPLTSGATLGPAGSLATERPGPRQGQYVLVVHGPAGAGKSTLLAKTLMDHLTDDSIGELPFVYIDTERATISLHEPLSLVAEMARQLAVQYPAQALPFTELSARARVKARKQRLLTEDLEDLREVATAKTISRAGLYESHASARDEESSATYELGTILGRAVRTSPPFVVVVDSFEGAQYLASPVLDRMWSMWSALREAYPLTRVIVAGRAPVGHPNIPADEVATVEIGELDLTAAVHFLGDRGVGLALAEAITTRIGGNPLSLRLAARVAGASREAHEDDDWILEVPRRRSSFRTVDDMLIQGMLYDRLLKHITNPLVRKLAHPSMVLRRITPDVIRTVLAPQCGVDVPDDATAWELFDELASELDLVERVAPAVLRHRPDVRRIMLRLLSTDDKRTVQAVERAAVLFYQDSDRPEDRAEELYHRLRLAENLSEVKARWTPEAAGALAGAEPELPARSARLLGRLVRGSPELPSTNADQVMWEQRTADEAEDLLTQGLEEEAKALLRQRMPWTQCSPLHALEVEVHLRLGELDDARRAVNAGLDEDQTEQCDEVRLELLLLSARVHAKSGDLASADADLDRAEQTASQLGRDLDALGALLMRARLHEQAAPDSRQAAAEDALIARVENTDDDVLATQPALFRAIAAEVGSRAPEILTQAVTQVGLPPLSGPAVADLAGVVTETLDEPGVAKVVAGLADQDSKQTADSPAAEVAQLLESADSNGRLDEVAQHLLATPDETGALTQGIAAAMAEGTEGPDV
jgi:tetratricopeptide (TPR) repeat protein/ABC-type transporter Mla maintaining outer membrane lipid asymmetry ATPase subunit MlaF